MVLALCTSSNIDWYLYEVSWRQLERFSSYRADRILWQKMDRQTLGRKTICLPTLKGGGGDIIKSIYNVNFGFANKTNNHLYVNLKVHKLILKVQNTAAATTFWIFFYHDFFFREKNNYRYFFICASVLHFACWVKFSADNILNIFCLFSLENRIWYFMQIVSLGDNLHEVSDSIV